MLFVRTLAKAAGECQKYLLKILTASLYDRSFRYDKKHHYNVSHILYT